MDECSAPLPEEHITMPNEWLALTRVGEDLGLTEEQLEEFLQESNALHKEMWKQQEGRYDMSDEYFDFLVSEVLAHERILNLLQEFSIEDSTLSRIEDSSYQITSKFKKQYTFSYGLDQLVDFIFLMKLVKDYSEFADSEWITPRDRLHYLLYLVNNELASETDYSARKSSVGLGMLERTGYRYVFRKQSNGAYSDRLARDKDILYSWNLLEEVVDDECTNKEYQPFKISLGSAGRILYNRRADQLDNLGSAESDLLRQWHFSQKDVLERFASMEINELKSHVSSINGYENKQEGEVLLTGRGKVFDSNVGSVMNIWRGIQNV